MSDVNEKNLEIIKTWNVDLGPTLERFCDDVELYVSCLQAFAEDRAFGELGEHIKAEEYSAAFDSAHTLKGVAGNLGLNDMFKAISNIVEPLRAGDYSNLDAQYTAIQEEYKKYLGELAQLVTE